MWGPESCSAPGICAHGCSHGSPRHQGSLYKEGLAGRCCREPRASLKLPQSMCWFLIPLPAFCLGSFPGIFYRLGYIWDQQPTTPFLTDSPAGAWLQQEAQREWGQCPRLCSPAPSFCSPPSLDDYKAGKAYKKRECAPFPGNTICPQSFPWSGLQCLQFRVAWEKSLGHESQGAALVAEML